MERDETLRVEYTPDHGSIGALLYASAEEPGNQESAGTPAEVDP